MRLHWLRAASLAAALVLTGCHKNVRVAAAPPLPPLVMIAVPPPGHPSEPEAEIAVEEAPALADLLPRQHVLRYRPSPLQQIAIAPLPPPPLELGHLTTGEAAPLRQQTEDLLRAQQRRLSGVSSAVAALHSQQMEQARMFLRQAEEAWRRMDVEGAHILATKAKVLLDEVLA